MSVKVEVVDVVAGMNWVWSVCCADRARNSSAASLPDFSKMSLEWKEVL